MKINNLCNNEDLSKYAKDFVAFQNIALRAPEPPPPPYL